ncbi:MAG: hypothetical protein WBP25_03880 [Giesbergeria sp.]
MPNAALLGRPQHEKPEPIPVSLFGLEAIVQIPNALPNLIQEALEYQMWRGSDFIGFIIPVRMASM